MATASVLTGDLILDVERLNKINETLTASCKSLTEELDVARLSIKENSYFKRDLEADYRTQSKQLKASRINSTKLQQNFHVIRRHLEFERSSHIDVRSEMQNCVHEITDSTTSGLKIIAEAFKRKEEETNVLRENLQLKVKQYAALEEGMSALRLTLKVKDDEYFAVEEVMNTLRSDLQLKGREYTALQRTSELEIASLHVSFQDASAEEGLSQRRRSATMAAQRQQLESGIKERIVLSEETSRLQLELKAAQLEVGSVTDLCVRLQQELVAESIAASSAVETYEKESIEKAALVEDMDKLKETCQGAMNKAVTFSEEVKQEREKYRVLSLSKESLHMELRMLRKEDTLKKEVGISGADKDDMQGRLWSIQEKVRAIELGHSDEIEILHFKIGETERERDTMLSQHFKSAQIHAELEIRIADSSHAINELNSQLSVMKDTISLNDVSSKSQVDKLLKELAVCRKEIVDIERSKKDLRADREQWDKKAFLSSQKVAENEVLLFAAMQEVESLKVAKEIERSFSVDALKMAGELKELKKSLSLAQQTAAERETEVFELKETIRKECEERVRNIVMIAELQRTIARQEERNEAVNNVYSSSPKRAHSFTGTKKPTINQTEQKEKQERLQQIHEQMVAVPPKEYQQLSQYQYQPLIQIQHPQHPPVNTAARSILINRQPEIIITSSMFPSASDIPLTSSFLRIPSTQSVTSLSSNVSPSASNDAHDEGGWTSQMARKPKPAKTKIRKASV